MKRIIFLTLILLATACKKTKTYQCNAGDPNIIGCKCNDGTTSNATGSGACSGHGGVQYWTCED